MTDFGQYTYAFGNRIVNIDPRGESTLVKVVIIVAAGGAAVYMLYRYLKYAEACQKYCEGQAEAGLCPDGDLRCYFNCMAGPNAAVTSGPGSDISTGLGPLLPTE